jgi:preprotein translocase subunit SecB
VFGSTCYWPVIVKKWGVYEVEGISSEGQSAQKIPEGMLSFTCRKLTFPARRSLSWMGPLL